VVRAESRARRGEPLVAGGARRTRWDRGVGERGVGGGVERVGAWEVSRRRTPSVMLGYSFVHDNARCSYSYSYSLFLGETRALLLFLFLFAIPRRDTGGRRNETRRIVRASRVS